MNTVLLVGNCACDPFIVTTKDGKARKFYCVIVATSRFTHKDEAGKWVEGSDFHRVIAKAKMSPVLSKFRKGDAIAIRGMVVSKRWQTKDGAWRSEAQIWPQQIERPRNPQDKERRALLEDDWKTVEQWMQDMDGV